MSNRYESKEQSFRPANPILSLVPRRPWKAEIFMTIKKKLGIQSAVDVFYSFTLCRVRDFVESSVLPAAAVSHGFARFRALSANLISEGKVG